LYSRADTMKQKIQKNSFHVAAPRAYSGTEDKATALRVKIA